MQNGTYIVRHKVLRDVTQKMIAYNGLMRLYHSDGTFIKSYAHDIVFKEYWSIEKQLPPEPKKYNIEWVVGGKQKEVIRMNASYAVCVHHIKLVKHKYHLGLLRPLRIF